VRDAILRQYLVAATGYQSIVASALAAAPRRSAQQKGQRLMGWFGASIKRKEDPALLTGRGRLCGRHQSCPACSMPWCCAAPTPHAGHPPASTSAPALALPGVRAVFTFSDLPPSMAAADRNRSWSRARPSSRPLCRTVSPSTKPVLSGEPIAIVVADSRYLAEGRGRAGRCGFSSRCRRCPIASRRWAAGAPLAHRDACSNLRRRHPGQWSGTPRAAFRAGAARVPRAAVHSIAVGPSSWSAAA